MKQWILLFLALLATIAVLLFLAAFPALMGKIL